MNRRTFGVSLLVVSLMCAAPCLHAHAVGNSSDSHFLRTWTNTVNHTTYRATFLLMHNDEVFLEDATGKVVSIPFENLATPDKAIADEHRERIRTINRSPAHAPIRLASSNPQTINTHNGTQIDTQNELVSSTSTILLLAFSLALVCGALCWLGLFFAKTFRLFGSRWFHSQLFISRLSEKHRLQASFFAACSVLVLALTVMELHIVPPALIAQTLNIYSKGIAYPTATSAIRSLKFSNKLSISTTTSSTPQSFDASAVDSIKILSTTSDPALMSLAFAPYKATATTSWDANYLYVSSNGIPAHNMMIGITAWIAQVPVPHPYTGTNSWSIPLKPELATSPLSVRSNFMRGAIAVAVNGIPIFNAFNASGLDSKAIGELDQWNGHCGRADDYHYHAAPLHLEATSGLQPIAFAFDGYAVYGSKEPDGTPMASLDQYHGHVGANGVYHYHGTTTSPYMIEAMRGKVSLDPRSTAPENQITPQAMTKAFRGDPFPINGATLTNLTANAAGNGYTLEYTIAGKKGTVAYTWTGSGLTGLYTFIFTATDGKVTTQMFQR